MTTSQQFRGIVWIWLTCLATLGRPLAAEARDVAAPATATALRSLQGKWEGFMVGHEAQGRITITISQQALSFHRETNFWFETTFTLLPGKDPQQLQATIQKCPPGQESSVGQVVTALYRIEGGTLTLVSLGGTDEEPPKSFEAVEGKGFDRYELRRVSQPSTEAAPPKAK